MMSDVGFIDDPRQPWSGAQLLQYLAGKLRIRVESGRERLDMKKVVHLEMLMPTWGDSRWVPISTADLEV